jgi:hypothetical protein
MAEKLLAEKSETHFSVFNCSAILRFLCDLLLEIGIPANSVAKGVHMTAE